MRQVTKEEIAEAEQGIRRHIDLLAGVLGERNVLHCPGALEGAAKYIEKTFRACGLEPASQHYTAMGHPVRNIEAEIPGYKPDGPIWIIGGHYDSIDGSPGADDNATAVAGVLEVARMLSGMRCRDTIRFVTFVNEEPPFYKGDEMGSLVYAKRCKSRGERIAGMINLEMLGYYSDEPGSQRYPIPLDRGVWKWLLPNRGNFIAFVGNFASWRLTWRCRRVFGRSVRFPARWVAAPAHLEGPGMSDHWSFWQQGYPAVMVTDTAFFRNRHYHQKSDAPDKIDFPRMAKVVAGLGGMMTRLVGGRRKK